MKYRYILIILLATLLLAACGPAPAEYENDCPQWAQAIVLEDECDVELRHHSVQVTYTLEMQGWEAARVHLSDKMTVTDTTGNVVVTQENGEIVNTDEQILLGVYYVRVRSHTIEPTITFKLSNDDENALDYINIELARAPQEQTSSD